MAPPGRPRPDQPRRIFRLYVLGNLESDSPLVTLAEFRATRAVERVRVDSVWVNELADGIAQLRGYIEGTLGYPRAALERLGDRLLRLVLQGTVRDLLNLASGEKPERFPLELIVEDHKILGWPWEFMYDSTRRKFVCQEFHPVARSVITARSRVVPTSADTLRVLLAVGVRPGDPRTQPEEQQRSISNAFGSFLQRESDRVSIDVLVDEPRDRVLEILASDKYDVFHFFGHAGVDERGGLLHFERANGTTYDISADRFAQRLIPGKARLVFLNACETAVGSAAEDTARNSVAIELMERGIPAVIATQFKMPARSSHRFAALVYGAIANGRSLIDAMVVGREAMDDEERGLFVDWGIPVLYSGDPNLVLFSPRGVRREKPRPRGRRRGDTGAVGATRSTTRKARARFRVALVDIDADVGFLPDLVRSANETQSYFEFLVSSQDVPAGAVVTDRSGFGLEAGGDLTKKGPVVTLDPDIELMGPQLYVPRIERYLADATDVHRADFVCYLTRYRVAARDRRTVLPNLFITPLDSNDHVSVVSTHMLREYAAKAKVSFAKATLFLCVGAVLDMQFDEMDFHTETRACVFDACIDPEEIVEGLSHMKLDDPACVRVINDDAVVGAVNRLFAIPDSAIGNGRRAKKSTPRAGVRPTHVSRGGRG